MHKCQDCKHEKIKYCPKCQKVYCEECGREWVDECTLNHYYPYNPYYYREPSIVNPYPCDPIYTTTCGTTSRYNPPDMYCYTIDTSCLH